MTPGFLHANSYINLFVYIYTTLPKIIFLTFRKEIANIFKQIVYLGREQCHRETENANWSICYVVLEENKKKHQ